MNLSTISATCVFNKSYEDLISHKKVSRKNSKSLNKSNKSISHIGYLMDPEKHPYMTY